MLQRELSVSIDGLRTVRVRCANCDTEVTLKLESFDLIAAQSQQERFNRKNFVPDQCPVCKNPYDSAITALCDFQILWTNKLKSAGDRIVFLLPDDET